MRSCASALAILLALAQPGDAQEQRRVLTMADAVATARAHRPELAQQRAQKRAADARARQVRAGFLPRLDLSARYERTTANFVPRPGFLPAGVAPTVGDPTWDTFNYWTFGATASVLIWDFGATLARYRAAQAAAESQARTVDAAELGVIADVQAAYLNAWTARALVAVARETLANQERHFAQVRGFVEAGTRPEIDLAQARADLANAKVQLARAEARYETSRALLNLYMGVDGPADFELADETVPPVPGEERLANDLVAEAIATRPELKALAAETRAAELGVDAARASYLPSISGTTGMTDEGGSLDDLRWNWGAGVTVTWPIFEGGLKRAQVQEQRANVVAARAREDTLRQQIRFEVTQAHLEVTAARSVVESAREALLAAAERLRLAEGRYEVGAGTIIELGDAQLAYTAAAAQRVQAQADLAVARVRLIRSLGRPV